MLSIQEIADKTRDSRRELKKNMDSFGLFKPKYSILNGLSRADEAEVLEALRGIPLREFLAKSGTTGLQGAVYMIPDKVHQDLIFYSEQTDKIPLLSAQVHHFKEGDTTYVNIADDRSFVPYPFTSGGSMPQTEANTTQATLDFVAGQFSMNINIGNDLIEDLQYDIIDWHIRAAGVAMGREATKRLLTPLIDSTDGVGTLNSANTGDVDETKLTGGTTSDIVLAIRKIGDDRWVPNTLISTVESWGHSISTQATMAGWNMLRPTTQGFHYTFGILDTLLLSFSELHAATDLEEDAFTNCISLIFDRANALFTGRKRWLQINNYANPVEDLTGAVVIGEQDTVSLYNDSVYKLTET